MEDIQLVNLSFFFDYVLRVKILYILYLWDDIGLLVQVMKFPTICIIQIIQYILYSLV